MQSRNRISLRQNAAFRRAAVARKKIHPQPPEFLPLYHVNQGSLFLPADSRALPFPHSAVHVLLFHPHTAIVCFSLRRRESTPAACFACPLWNREQQIRRCLPSGVSGLTVFSTGAMECHRCVFLTLRLLLPSVVSAVGYTRFLQPLMYADSPNPQY